MYLRVCVMLRSVCSSIARVAAQSSSDAPVTLSYKQQRFCLGRKVIDQMFWTLKITDVTERRCGEGETWMRCFPLNKKDSRFIKCAFKKTLTTVTV